MKKCRQCGILSADTATVCRHCNAKFTEEDKPIVAETAKKNKSIFAVLTITVIILAIIVFILFRTGMFKTWSQASEKAEIKAIAEEFINADFEKDAQKVSGYMFDGYINYHEQEGTFLLDSNKYTSFYFSMYNPNSSIEVLGVNPKFLEGEEFQYFSDEITKKYSVTPQKIVYIEETEVKITDNELSSTVSTPMTFIELDGKWFILPIL